MSTAASCTERASVPRGLRVRAARCASLGLALYALFGMLALPQPASAEGGDIGSGCDSLYSDTAGNHTVWGFFSHPCPPEPEESAAVILPGVGVTVRGIWAVPTLSNPLGFPVSQNNPSLNAELQNGFGGGLEITGWFTPNLALRLQFGLLDFPAAPGYAAFQVMPVTLGAEIRLLGSRSVFLYVAADGGIAINGQNASNIFSGTAGSPYVQAGVGLNIYFLELEADYAAVASPLGGLAHTNPFFFLPLSIGIHL